MCIINIIAGWSAYHILIHSKQPRKSKLFACIYIQYFIIQKSLLCFSPSYLYIALCCCCMFWFFNNVSQAVMDNIWYSSATHAAALKMSLRHYHISLRAGVLPWFCTSESLFFAMPALSSFPCLPHPFNLCWELRPSHALTPPPSKKKNKKTTAHMIRLVFKQRLQNDATSLTRCRLCCWCGRLSSASC